MGEFTLDEALMGALNVIIESSWDQGPPSSLQSGYRNRSDGNIQGDLSQL